MSKSSNTGALQKAINKNKTESGHVEIIGNTPMEKAINKNRLAAGLSQKPAGFKSQPKNNEEN